MAAEMWWATAGGRAARTATASAPRRTPCATADTRRPCEPRQRDRQTVIHWSATAQRQSAIYQSVALKNISPFYDMCPSVSDRNKPMRVGRSNWFLLRGYVISSIGQCIDFRELKGLNLLLQLLCQHLNNACNGSAIGTAIICAFVVIFLACRSTRNHSYREMTAELQRKKGQSTISVDCIAYHSAHNTWAFYKVDICSKCASTTVFSWLPWQKICAHLLMGKTISCILAWRSLYSERCKFILRIFWELSCILPIFQTYCTSTSFHHPLERYLSVEWRLQNPGRFVLAKQLGYVGCGPVADMRAKVPLVPLQSKQKVRPRTLALPLLYPENTFHLRLTTNRKCSWFSDFGVWTSKYLNIA